MARTQALAAAVALVLAPAAARGEPLDLSFARLGAPSASVWAALDARDASVTLAAGEAEALAAEAKQRFAILSIETALALSAPVLQPASTTGVAGWDVSFEGAYVAVHPDRVGQTSFGTSFGPRGPWQTRGAAPTGLLATGLHVRKALPWSVELGGRLTYLAESNYGAAQVEGKWALVEGFSAWPDVALRGAYTTVVGHRHWDLSTLEADLLVSKRFGLDAVTSLTPYVAARWNQVRASTEVLDFGPTPAADPTPAQLAESQAAFPSLRAALWRVTLGARFAASTFSAGVEGTWLPGTTVAGESAPDAGEYPDVPVAGSFGAALRLGWEF